MSQQEIWENEYKSPRLVTGSKTPSNDFKRFVKWLKKDRKLSMQGLRVLDLGSGLGKNAIFLAERGAEVVGLEISEIAIEEAKRRAKQAGITLAQLRASSIPERSNLSLGKIASSRLKSELAISETLDGSVTFLHHDIGSPYPFADESFDLVPDVISSNSLDEKGRSVYLKEVHRVLKNDGYFFVRTLCKDGDKNAEALLEKSPGKEKDTYIMPEFGLVERVFSKQNFIDTYSKYFTILQLTKKSGYAKFAGKIYKRNYWLGYMQKM